MVNMNTYKRKKDRDPQEITHDLEKEIAISQALFSGVPDSCTLCNRSFEDRKRNEKNEKHCTFCEGE